ncbi:MAG: ATP-binding protein [Bacteroidales bacterium]
MKKAFLSCFIYFLFSYFLVPAFGAELTAEKGIFDLRESAGNKFIFELNGEWEFYWSKKLVPRDFKLASPPVPDLFGQVPSYWTSYRTESLKPSGKGYATYRLRILLPPGYRNSLAVDMPVFDSSYEVYIDGKKMGRNGIPGVTEDYTEPDYKRHFFRFNPDADTIEIVINVSNFHHRRGGFWIPMKIGTFNEIQQDYAAGWAKDWSSMSFLLAFSLLFFFFFVIFSRDKQTAFFSIAVTGLAIRPLFTSNFLIHNIMDISWDWIVRWEYLGLYVIITGWYWFALNLYRSKWFRIITRGVTIILSIAAVVTIAFPVDVFSYATFIIYPLLVILFSTVLFESVKGVIKGNLIDFFYFLTFIMLGAAAVNDVRISLGKQAVFSGYILTQAIVVFVFIQAVLILYKWVKAYSEKEKLQKEHEYLNRHLEKIVNDRTHEIIARKEEIEEQNIRIAAQNKKLSETIQLKNKIFSVIAHDLRSPVVNILYMLNLLKEEEYKEKYNSFADASIEYSQQVISLLENMLVWGRGQEDKIRYAPGKHDLADIILTNLSIFKETADKKSIKVNFTQVGNSKGFFDKDLLDIIIRNLLSNAVKYTPRGGRISILLKDKSNTREGILLKVCDNGVGIPEEKQKELFTASEIESTPGTENEKGTGFGIKLCYELVKINGGTMSVESREGEGACFTITLPDSTG